MTKDVKIAIVGKNEIVREGLRRILLERDLDVVAAYGSVDALFAEQWPEQAVNMVIVDAASLTEGKEACRQVRAAMPDTKIVLLGDDISLEATSDAMAAGVDGYLAKEISCTPLACSISLVAAGEKVMPSQMVSQMTATKWNGPAAEWLTTNDEIRLSSREIEVLRCLTRGEANKSISRALDVTEATVKIHIKAIMRKLKVQNRTQAALWAMSRGVADTSPALHEVH